MLCNTVHKIQLKKPPGWCRHIFWGNKNSWKKISAWKSAGRPSEYLSMAIRRDCPGKWKTKDLDLNMETSQRETINKTSNLKTSVPNILITVDNSPLKHKHLNIFFQENNQLKKPQRGNITMKNLDNEKLIESYIAWKIF